MRIEQVAPKIYAIIGKTSKEVASVMIRIQENYESPKFRNKVFTLDEFIPWYKESRHKPFFTYFDDWSGFNVPSYVLKRFWNGKFNPLREEEQWLMNELEKLQIKGKFYLLGYSEEDARVKKHEIAHGLFYTNRKYKREVLEALAQHGIQEPVFKHLLDHGYCQEVLIDEYHAWTLTDRELLEDAGLWNKELAKLQVVLDTIFEKYTKPKKPRKTRSDKGVKRHHCSGYGWCELHGEHGP